MRRLPEIPLAAAAALLLLAERAGAERGVIGENVYRAAEAAWRGCFPAGAPVLAFPERPDPQDFGATVEVRRTSSGFHVKQSYVSSSVEVGGYSNVAIDFQPQGCRALWAETNGHDGGLAGRVEAGWTKRGAPTEAEIRALIAEPARTDDPRHAFARSWLLHRCPGGPDSDLSWERGVEGPIAPTQPWYDGLPRGAPPTFWSAAALNAIGAGGVLRRFDQGEDDDPPPASRHVGLDGMWIPRTGGRPAPTFATGRFQLFETSIPGRNGGRAIALLDRATNRHRWVVTTRGCVQGTTVSWLGTIGARIVGVTRSRHDRYAEGDAILIIDTPTATAWAVQVPESIREAVVESGGKPHASLSHSILALRVLRSKANLDLAPLLSLIPLTEAHAP